MLYSLVKPGSPTHADVLVLPDDPNKPAVIRSYNLADGRLTGEQEISRGEGLKRAAEYAKEREQEQIEFDGERKQHPDRFQGVKGPLERDAELFGRLIPGYERETITLYLEGRPDSKEGVQERVRIDPRNPDEAKFTGLLDGREMYSLRLTRSFALEKAAEYEFAREREKANDRNKQNDPDRKKEDDKLKNYLQTNPALLAKGCKDLASAVIYLHWIERKIQLALQERDNLERQAKGLFGLKNIQKQQDSVQQELQYFGREHREVGSMAQQEVKIAERTNEITQKQAPARNMAIKVYKEQINLSNTGNEKNRENDARYNKEDTIDEENDKKYKQEQEKRRYRGMERSLEPN